MIRYRVTVKHKWLTRFYESSLEQAFGKKNVFYCCTTDSIINNSISTYMHDLSQFADKNEHFIVAVDNTAIVTKFLLTNTDGLEFEEMV